MISPTRNDRWFFSALLVLLLALPALPTRGQEDLSSQLTLFQLQLSRTLGRLQQGLTGIDHPDVRIGEPP